MKNCILVFFFLYGFILHGVTVSAQPLKYSASNAHAHNDYAQPNPFYTAYLEKFGSIEADIFLVNGQLLVAHELKQVDAKKTLEALYLIPLNEYADTHRTFQLLIDIKTESIATLDTLIQVLKKYPSLIQNPKIKMIVSGNRPPENAYASYPSFIWFDGRLNKEYTPAQLEKIAMLSEDFGKFTQWKRTWPIGNHEQQALTLAIQKAHAYKKPVRLWGSPDFAAAWEGLMEMEVDFINTDKIKELAQFLHHWPGKTTF